MSIDNDEIFEQRLRNLLKRTGNVAVPPLTPERLESLRALIPVSDASIPFLSFLWRHAVDRVGETLSLVESMGLTISSPAVPVIRGEEGKDDASYLETASLTLPDGELRVQILPVAKRRARLLLSVKGACANTEKLSVELLLGDRLIEARPLEQIAEFSLTGSGKFTIVLFSGDEAIGKMRLGIGDAGDSRHDG